MGKKELCKLKKDDLRQMLPRLARELPQGRYICRKCARIAPTKDLLCKPVNIDKLVDEQLLAEELLEQAD